MLSVIMVFSTWTITDRSYLNFLDNDNLTPDEDYFLRLRFHHRNLLALSWEEKAALAPSFEGQLVPLANHIVQLRRRPEFTAINQTFWKGAKNLGRALPPSSKHLKGRLDAPVGDVTFLHQRRSVESSFAPKCT